MENVKQILQWGPLIAKRDKATGRVMKLGGQVAAPGEVVPVHQQFLVPDPKRRGTTWRRFVALLEGMGYAVEWRVIKACDFGAPTSRERLFMIARCDGQPIVWPEPTHARKPVKGQQKWRTAADCIDWSVPSKSIFGRKKDLAPATLRRVAKGLKKFVIDSADPFIVPIANWSGELAQSAREPLRTVTAWPRGGSFAIASPTLIQTSYGERAGQQPRMPGLDQPLGTVVAGGAKHALVSAFMAQANGGFNTTHAKGLDEPMTTVTNTGSQQQLVSASLATLRRNCIGRPMNEPVPTLTAGAEHHALLEYTLSPEHEEGALRVAAFLISYYGTDNVSGCASPAPTITTKDRLGLVTVFVRGTPYVIVDICLRMLQPHELYRAQGFPADYIIAKGADGRRFTKTEQVHMCGNSVSPPPMAALARANNPWRVNALQEEAA